MKGKPHEAAAVASRNKQSGEDFSPEEYSINMAPPQAIHRCLEHICKRLHLRARLFLQEDNDLVLRDCAGAYGCCPENGLKVHPSSVVWQTVRQGTPVNLTESVSRDCVPSSLPEPVLIKAIIPLTGGNAETGLGKNLGVLVVDSGDSFQPIQTRDFQYLEVLGMLISEILQRAKLLAKIRSVQREKEMMSREVSHICRNRFLLIGGFARKLRQALQGQDLKECADIILEQVEKAERALNHWKSMEEEVPPDLDVYM